MSKYDAERQTMGLPLVGAPIASPETNSKYAADRSQYAQQQHADEVQLSDQAQMDYASKVAHERTVADQMSLLKSGSNLDVSKSPMLQEIHQYNAEHPPFQLSQSDLNKTYQAIGINRPQSNNFATNPTEEALMYGAQGIAKGAGVYALGQFVPNLNLPQVTPEEAKNISPTQARIADFTGQAVGSILPIEGAYSTGGKLAAGALTRLAPNAPKLAQAAVKGAGAGLAYGTGRQVLDAAAGNEKPIGERLKEVGLDTLLFAGGDSALTGLGRLSSAAKTASENGLMQAERRPDLAQAVNDFISRTKQSEIPVHPTGAITHELAPGDAASTGKQLAGNFAKSEEFQKQYEQAVQDQRDYLKQSMDNRSGVDQGGVIKDPVTGEVIDRYGRISNNPEWYQEFYKENGRSPTDKDLMELAKNHVDKGFQTEVGRAPAFRPDELHEIDSQLQEIKDALPHADDTTKESLRTTAATLEKEQARLKRLLPEDVVAMKASESKYAAERTQMANDTQAYAGNSKPFRQAQTQTEKTISRTDVINNMRKNLGVTMDTGRLSSKGRGVLGEYKITPEVIRSRMSQDIQVISHEIGHHLDKKLGLQAHNFQSEFDNLMQTTGHNTGAYQPHQLPSEGIAEYVRLRLTDPAEATRLAPNFEKFFESKVPKKTLDGLSKTQKDIDTWITQGEYAQAQGLVDFTGGEKKTNFNYDKWYTQFVDDLNPLKLLEKALNGVIGIGKDSIYKMARLSRGISDRAELAVSKGIYDAAGNKISDGMTEIVRPLEEIGMKVKDFATYLAVKHAQDLKAMGKRVPFDDRQMQAVMTKWDNNPVVQTAQKKIIQFNNALTDILVEAQILSPKAVAEMRQKYPNYVPFMRYFDDDAVAGFKNGGFGSAKGFANLSNPVKRMSEEGSLRTIVNPIESMVKNAFLVMNAAAKNKVGLQLAELSKIDGAGSWVEHVGEGGASPHEHIVSVYQNGERNSFKVRNPDLYNAMLSLDAESTNSLIRFLGGAASLLRAGATLTPDFMVRNMMRDVIGNTVNSTKYGFNPLTIFSGLFHIVSPKLGGSSKVFDQFVSSGGAMGTMMSLDRDMNREALKKVFRETLKDKTLNVITSPKELAKFLSGYTPAKAAVGVLRKGSELSELSTRVGAFNKALKKTGSLEEAAYTARDLMDFNRAGSSIRQANRAVAFLNANIQGTDRMARAYKDNPASFLVRAFTTLVLPAATVYYWNHNLPPEQKKIYDNIPQWQKDSFFVIGVPGTGLFLRIPKPFEAGMLFATGTERTLRWFQDHDPEAFKDYGKTMLGALTPPMLMTALTPMLEAVTNHSFFRNAPIVPQGEQRLEKKDQYGLFTSETSKLIGGLVSKTPLADSNAASPRIIDNTIKGYTAGLGNYAVQGLDSVIRGVSGKKQTPLPAKQISEKPFLQSFFASTSGGGQVRQDFYDKWDQLSKAKASADRNQQQFNAPDYQRMKAADSQITKVMKGYKQIQGDKNMDPQTKRAKLDQLDNQLNDIAAKGLGR